MFIDPATDIVIIALVMSIVSQLLRRRFVDEQAMKEYQKNMKERQEKMKELMKKEDQKSKQELENMQKEMMEGMSTMMQGNMKMMMVSMGIFIPLFFIVGLFYSEAVIALPIPIPWFGTEQLIQLYTETSWIGWYVLNSLIFGILINVGVKGFGKIRTAQSIEG